MDVKDLRSAGIYVPYEQIPIETVTEVKCRLLDSVLALIGGALAMPADELSTIADLVQENGNVRPVWPSDISTNLEMAGFLNAYFMRYADWGDTYRRAGGIGGHPSDQLAAILALAGTQAVSGRSIIELTHMAYQLWYSLQEGMMKSRRDLDYTTTLALTIPLLAGTCFEVSPERMQDALNISASGGAVLEQVRTGGTTNLKSAASAYAIARGFWCYRISEAIHAPDSIFDGKYGWYNVFAPLESELTGSGEMAYQPLEIKNYACFNGAQASVECMVNLSDTLKGKLENIRRIAIRVSSVDAGVVIRPGQADYPATQADADHNLKYCAATALQFGALTPLHFSSAYLENAKTRRLIDVIDVGVLSESESAALNNRDGSCLVEITMDDGAEMFASCERAAGILSGLEPDVRLERLHDIIDGKRRMAESAGRFDLTRVKDIIFSLEKYEGYALIDAIQAELQR